MFYIGITGSPKRRLQQHRSRSKYGHEDVYVFIRSLEAKGIEWDLDIIREVDTSEDEAAEYLAVIDAIRSGHALKNMRFGKSKNVSLAQLKRLSKNPKVTDEHSLKSALVDDETNQFEASRKVEVRAILKSLRFLRTETDTNNTKWNFYDRGDGTEEIKTGFYVKKQEIAESLIPSLHQQLDDIKRSLIKPA